MFSETMSGKGESPDIVRKLILNNSLYKHLFDAIPEGRKPETLHCYGDTALLSNPMVMICGSRQASVHGCELAYHCAERLSVQGITVVSGWARGIDRAAHAGALDAGGDTIAFLPYGINKLFRQRGFSGNYPVEHLLAVSHTGPDERFSVNTAYQRNRYMAAVSSAVIAIEPGDTGGTWYSARQARKLNKPLFYLEGGRDDYRYRLEKIGAVRLDIVDGWPIVDEVSQIACAPE